MGLVNVWSGIRQGVLDWVFSPAHERQLETLEIVLDADQMDMILASMAQVRRCHPGDLVSVAQAFGDLVAP